MKELVLGCALTGTFILIDYLALCIALKRDKDAPLRSMILLFTVIMWVAFYYLTH